MPRAALYVRVSTAEQAERYGLASQITALARRAQERGYTIVHEGEQEAFGTTGTPGAT